MNQKKNENYFYSRVPTLIKSKRDFIFRRLVLKSCGASKKHFPCVNQSRLVNEHESFVSKGKNLGISSVFRSTRGRMPAE